MTHVLSVVGARPNFIKVGALYTAFAARDDIHHRVLHTGQHYDERMSDVFFRQLGLPEPDVYLGIGSGSHAEQTARVMTAFETELLRDRPDVVVVVGDVNSTLACALVAAKLGIPVAHVEAGLRSGDRSMPEEINRIATDAVSDYYFVTEQSALEHLKREGAPSDRVHLVGNVMIDTLVRLRPASAATGTLARFGVDPGTYAVVTMHRPATVDTLDGLETLATLLTRLAASAPVIFPVHPRTNANLEQAGLNDTLKATPGLTLTGPMGYLEFLDLVAGAGAVVTDSGGLQEETTYLGVPCLTLRDSTERPVTVDVGSNQLLPLDAPTVVTAVREALEGRGKQGATPPLWDGRAAERIAEILAVGVSPR